MTNGDLDRSAYAFAADAHLGKLARVLRMLGYDTAYSNTWSFADLLSIGSAENRIVLSRNTQFALRPEVAAIIIASEQYVEQLLQVDRQLSVTKSILPFSRCLACNGLLAAVTKERVVNLLKEQTRRHYSDFWQCCDCQKVYWKGPHFDRMRYFIESFRAKPEQL